MNVLLVLVLVLCGSFVPSPSGGGHYGPRGAAAALAGLDADAYRARIVPVAHPVGAAKVILERDVAASAAVGVRDRDPNRDGWAVAGRSPRLRVVRVVSVDVVDGKPEVTVVTEPDQCRVLSPARLAPVGWLPPRPLRVADVDPARCAKDPGGEVEIADLVVTADPDVSRLTTATVGQAGGTVRTTGADGRTYTLVVPAGAVAETVEISLAPAAVAGLDPVADDVLAGVSLQPAGLVFAVPATLEVRLPDGSTLPARPVFASTHRDGDPGLELPTFRRGDDNSSLTMRIDHFSSAAVWTGTTTQLEKLFKAAVEDVPQIAEQLPSLPPAVAAYVSGQPGSAGPYAEQVALYYTSIVVPALAAAADSPGELAAAVAVTNRLRMLTAVIGSGDDDPLLPTPIGQATTVLDLVSLLEGQVGGAAAALQDAYLQPACSADVVVARDWITVPAFLFGEAQLLDAGAAVRTVDRSTSCFFVSTVSGLDPTTLTIDDRFVAVEVQIVLDLPGQTPVPAGSDTVALTGGRFGVPQAGFVTLAATGGEFVVPGGTDPVLSQAFTDGEGRLTATVDRGEDPEKRALQLRVVGDGRPVTALAQLGTFDVDLITGPVDLLAGSDEEGLTVERFDPSLVTPPITEQILQPGGTTPVCVQVRDRLDALRPGVPVTFRLIEGPGTMTETVVDTIFDAPGVTQGTACLDYEHPDGPVPPGTTAVVGAEAQLEDEFADTEIVLTPYAVDVRLSARPEGEPGFVDVTDGALPSDPGVGVDVQVVLEATQGAVGDPLTPLAGGSVFATVEDGDGFLTVGGIPVVPLALTTDAFGAAAFTWNPATDEGGLLRVAHPATGPGVFATARFGPDPQVIEGDVVVTTDAEAEELAGVVEITGSLRIGGPASTVTDLSPAGSLKRVGGLLVVSGNPSLTDLDGLDDLESAGGLVVVSNPALTGLDGLGALSDLAGGTLEVRGNPVLVSLAGLESLTGSVQRLTVSRNPLLTDLVGLAGITAVEDTLEVDGLGLQSLAGLQSVTSTGDVRIDPNAFAALTDYSLPSLTTTGSFGVQIGPSDASAPGTAPGSLAVVSLPLLSVVGSFPITVKDLVGTMLTVDAPLVSSTFAVDVRSNTDSEVTVHYRSGGLDIGDNVGGRVTVRADSATFFTISDNQNTLVDVTVSASQFSPAIDRNVGLDLDTVRIGSAPGALVRSNVGFSDAQARAWAEGLGAPPAQLVISGNRPS